MHQNRVQDCGNRAKAVPGVMCVLDPNLLRNRRIMEGNGILSLPIMRTTHNVAAQSIGRSQDALCGMDLCDKSLVGTTKAPALSPAPAQRTASPITEFGNRRCKQMSSTGEGGRLNANFRLRNGEASRRTRSRSRGAMFAEGTKPPFSGARATVFGIRYFTGWVYSSGK